MIIANKHIAYVNARALVHKNFLGVRMVSDDPAAELLDRAASRFDVKFASHHVS